MPRSEVAARSNLEVDIFVVVWFDIYVAKGPPLITLCTKEGRSSTARKNNGVRPVNNLPGPNHTLGGTLRLPGYDNSRTH